MNESEDYLDMDTTTYFETTGVPVSCDVSTKRSYSALVTDNGEILTLTGTTWQDKITLQIDLFLVNSGSVIQTYFGDTLNYLTDDRFIFAYSQEEMHTDGVTSNGSVLIICIFQGSSTIDEKMKKYISYSGTLEVSEAIVITEENFFYVTAFDGINMVSMSFTYSGSGSSWSLVAEEQKEVSDEFHGLSFFYEAPQAYLSSCQKTLTDMVGFIQEIDFSVGDPQFANYSWLSGHSGASGHRCLDSRMTSASVSFDYYMDASNDFVLVRFDHSAPQIRLYSTITEIRIDSTKEPAILKGDFGASFSFFAGSAEYIDTQNSGQSIAFFTKIDEDLFIDFAVGNTASDEDSPTQSGGFIPTSSLNFGTLTSATSVDYAVSTITFESLTYATTYDTYLTTQFNEGITITTTKVNLEEYLLGAPAAEFQAASATLICDEAGTMTWKYSLGWVSPLWWIADDQYPYISCFTNNIFDVKDYDVPLKVKYFTPGLTDSTWFWYSSLGIKVYTGFNSDPFFQLDIDGLKLQVTEEDEYVYYFPGIFERDAD